MWSAKIRDHRSAVLLPSNESRGVSMISITALDSVSWKDWALWCSTMGVGGNKLSASHVALFLPRAMRGAFPKSQIPF